MATFRIQKKRDGCTKLDSRYSQKSRHNTEEDAPRSLSHSQKECAHQREAEKRLESEIGGVFVVFVGGGDLRNLFSGGHFCDFFNGRDLFGRKASE